jgi:hypothetical protein
VLAREGAVFALNAAVVLSMTGSKTTISIDAILPFADVVWLTGGQSTVRPSMVHPMTLAGGPTGIWYSRPEAVIMVPEAPASSSVTKIVRHSDVSVFHKVIHGAD